MRHATVEAAEAEAAAHGLTLPAELVEIDLGSMLEAEGAEVELHVIRKDKSLAAATIARVDRANKDVPILSINNFAR